MNGTVTKHFKQFIAEGILTPRDSNGVYEVNMSALLAAISVEEAKFAGIDNDQPKSRAEYMRNRRKKLKDRRKPKAKAKT